MRRLNVGPRIDAVADQPPSLPDCIVSPYGLGMSRRPLNFLIGFVGGALLSLLWNALPIIRAGASRSIPGIWLDIAIQAVIIGLLFGAVALWLGEWRKTKN